VNSLDLLNGLPSGGPPDPPMPVPPTRVGGVGSDPTAPARDAGAVLVPAGDVGDGLRTAQPTEPASCPEQFPGPGTLEPNR